MRRGGGGGGRVRWMRCDAMRGETCPGSLGTKTTDVKKTTVRAAAAKRCQRGEREVAGIFGYSLFATDAQECSRLGESCLFLFRIVGLPGLGVLLGWLGAVWDAPPAPSSRGPASEPLNRAIDRPATKDKTASIRLGLCPLYASGPVPARRSSLWGMWGLMRPTKFLHRNQGQHHPIPLFLQHHPQTDPRHQQTATRQPGPTSQPPQLNTTAAPLTPQQQ